MILDTTIKLDAVLAGAVANNQPEFHVGYVDWNKDGEQTPPAMTRGALNSTTDVVLLAAPVLPTPVRQIETLSIYNKDTASVTVTIKTDDGTTERIIYQSVVGTLKTLCWERTVGWYLTTA